MSLDVLRERALERKKHEVESSARAQITGLLALQAVTTLLTKNTSLSSLLSCKHDADNTSNLTSDQLQFLKSNALSNGCRLDEATLPFPELASDAVSHTNETDNGLAIAKTESGPSKDDHGVARTPHRTVPTNESSTDAARRSRQPSPSRVRPAAEVPLNDIAPPEPEEEAQFDTKTKELIARESPKRPAKTVHLPPEHVQEQRLHEAAEERSHGHPTDSTAQRPHIHHDLASSPSSTVGAHSAATPMPPQDSPDTSPDSETATVEVPPEYRPTPEEQKAKDQHDRQLAAQKAVAHQAALGDVNTPDDQLHWEERAAAAREQEELKATTDKDGPEPLIVDGAGATQAAAFATEKQHEVEAAQVDKPAFSESQDNINVTPRVGQTRLHGTSAGEPATQQSSANRPAPARTSSDWTHDRVHSPVSVRRPDTGDAGPSGSPKQSLWSPPKPEKSDVEAIFAGLLSLQGAASDPERDYLEPLFKIQAHDSPNIRTSALPDLIRAASKTISTDDQFTSMHERMEYRILRRIYHLQNANKWSLRQMEKCKEPPKPVSHHDHMMAEMRWMCKDFRAERKRKKSVCAWLATQCAEYIAADEHTRQHLRVNVRGSTSQHGHTLENDDVPELDTTAESPTTLEHMPGTPTAHEQFPSRIVVDTALIGSVTELQRAGALPRALKTIPVWQPDEDDTPPAHPEMASVSKFVNGKVLTKPQRPGRKRSRYDYEDEGDEDQTSKRMRADSDLPPEDADVAIFHPDNKAIRDRLHAQNAFRPPSEFQMPSIPFYEFRNGSQWLAEDDHKLRRLAKDYSFNWSIISDHMALPSRFKSGMERRTPWECFERWVELEQMPAEMRKTVYFKTWYSRLEQSQQNVEKRYQAQIAQVQAQAQQSGLPPQHPPMRRRTVPSRVEKRKATRYLWNVDAMRKNAKKRELAAYKQAEATRAAAQRKASQQTETQQPRQQMLTPQQFSQKRYERDLQVAEVQRAHRQKLIEAQQRQAQAARMAVQGQPAGAAPQQRPNGASAGPQQAQSQGSTPNVNAQLTPQQRQQLQLAARNQAALSQGQNVPQAQMTATGAQQQNMQRLQAQMQAQGRSGQFPSQQHQFAALQAGNTASPGHGNMTTQQQLASQQALLAAAYQAQQQGTPNGTQTPGQGTSTQQMAASPNMPPPPAPQQLSSGLVPAVIAIKNQLRANYPNLSEDQLQAYATDRLQKQQSSSAVRQSAMAAAAGLTQGTNGNNVNIQAYSANQSGFQNSGSSANTTYNTQDGSAQPSAMNGTNGSTQHSYAQMMRQRQMAQMRLQQSPNATHAVPNGSPNVNHASPNMTPASPAMQYNNANMNMAGQRPPSRSATPQMQRLGSSGSVPGVAVSGIQSPGAVNVQASPRGMQANMAR